MLRPLKHPIETFRSVPVQCTGMAISSGSVAIVVATSETHIAPPNAFELKGLALNIGLLALQSVVAKGKLKLRDRLETTLDQYGFDERAMNLTTSTWCTRQTALVACENNGFSSEYKALCARNSDGASLTWVPHI